VLGVGGDSGLRTQDWRSAGPDQYLAAFIDGDPLPVDQFCCEVGQIVIIELELALQRPIGEPATTLEQGYGLVKNRFKVHYSPFACSSSSAFASYKSFVSNPSVNQWQMADNV